MFRDVQDRHPDSFISQSRRAAEKFIIPRWALPQAISFSDRCKYVPVRSEISSLKSKRNIWNALNTND